MKEIVSKKYINALFALKLKKTDPDQYNTLVNGTDKGD